MRNCLSESYLASFEVLNGFKKTFHYFYCIAHLKQNLLFLYGSLFLYLLLKLSMHHLIAIDLLIEDVLK
jgi:hypothetical protein